MSTPKLHHYVPEMHQRAFTNAEGQVFFFDRESPTKGVQKRNPRSVFRTKHLYSLTSPSGAKDASFEVALGRFEDKVAPLIKKMIEATRKGNTHAICNSDIELWLIYFYLQAKRTPCSQKQNLRNIDPEALLDDVLAEARFLFPDEEAEIEMLNHPMERARLIENARVNATSRASRTVLDTLKSRSISVARIVRSGSSFVLGSHPVVRMQSNDIRDLTTEMWLPIAPDVAVGLGRGEVGIPIFELSNGAAVRRMNVAITAQSRIIAGQSFELVQSLARHFGHRP